ncbi:MAG: chitobiase/beta-hexosaminidase C-terminal domain-containing protein, partial [Verrucomicrobiales bacterium]
MRHPIAACVLLPLLMCVPARAERVADTKFSIGRGFYEAAISVSISSATPGAYISYTTDGTAPHASGGAPAPVTVSIDRSLPLRAMAYLPSGEMEPTNIDTQTYVVLSNPMRWSGKTYTNSSAYPPAIIESLQSLPALFLAIAPSDFETVRDSGTGGIGQSGGNEQYERPCSAELWYPPNSRFEGFAGFQIDAGLRPHSWVTTKRAFRLYFKRQYGSGKLRYPVFESAPWNGESAVEEFDKLMLRHHSNDGWEGRWGGADEALYLRDQFARSCQVDMGGPGTRSTWAHLFVNGAYYGLYNPTERPDDDFLASYLGGDDSDYLGFNHGGVINDGADEAIYNAYRNPGDLSGAAAYTAFQGVLNPEQFSDYLVSSWFNTTHSHDWPVNGTRPQNFYGGNRNTPAAGTMHFTWDFEAALVWDSVVHEKFRRGSADADREFIKTWFALVENDEFMGLFADRAYRHLFNGGALTNTRSRQRLDAMAAHVEPALAAEKWQWGGEHDNWLTQLAAARAKLVTNPGNLISSLRSESYYPAIDPPHVKIGANAITTDRLRTAAGTEIILENPNSAVGEIRYTIDGSDPDETGAPAGGDSHSLTITTTTLIRTRVVNGGTSSALRELLVIVPQDLSALRLSEVMYHPAPQPAVAEASVVKIVGDADLGRARIDLAIPPPGDLRGGDSIRIAGGLDKNTGTFEIAGVAGNSLFIKASLTDDASGLPVADLLYDGDRFEFVEVENSGSAPLHLGAVEFSKGIDFSFDPNFSLGAGARAVIATRPWDFAERYPTVQVAGEFLRTLDNSGETIELAQTDRARHQVTALSPGGEITFASLPPGAVAGNRIRITGCERVTNNGSYRILAVGGNVVTVGKAFVAAPDGAYAQLFEVIDAVEYDDSGAWPRAADGLGYSLVRDGVGWRASSLSGGTPGAGDPPPPIHPT